MIQDKSENFKETNEFLENRLNDVSNFGKLKSEVKIIPKSTEIFKISPGLQNNPPPIKIIKKIKIYNYP